MLGVEVGFVNLITATEWIATDSFDQLSGLIIIAVQDNSLDGNGRSNVELRDAVTN